MKIKLLTDNNTLIDRYFLGEPGFSAYIEDENTSLLFDLGYSDVFLKNAQKMNIRFSELDFVAVSHGHCDHTWGMEALIRYYAELQFEKTSYKKPVLIAHPQTFTSVSADGYSEIGSFISQKTIAKYFDLHLARKAQKITERLFYLGEIPRKNDFEGFASFGRKEGDITPDYVREDSAIVYKASAGLVIITGCSHSGICNIIEYAQKLTHENRILDIIGGFHLLNASEKQMAATISYFERQQIKRIHPCHCTDLKAKISLAQVVPVEDAGVGLELEYEGE